LTAPLVIVGAGIAGLAFGLALKKRGINALVLERRLELPVEGAGIQIGPNGTQCLRALGLFDAVRADASVPKAIVVHDGTSGLALTHLPLGAWIEQRHGAPYWVTRRIDLVRALYNAGLAAGLEVRFGVDVERVQDATDGVVVSLADGANIDASGVVGADGVWSCIRTALFGGEDGPAAGRVAARALVRSAAVPDIRRDAVSVWMAPDTHLVCYPVLRGEALNIVLISQGDDVTARWSLPVDGPEMRRRFMAFPAPVQALATAADHWRQWPLVTRAPLAHSAVGRVGLIGDAAHPMLPFLAQGAVMALEDALALADHVDLARGDIARALADYSAARVARTQRVVRTAEQQGRIYHLSGPMRLARNMALRLAPPGLMMRRYDWLYGADPTRNAYFPG
jgi:salicylate hydroxylase